MTDPAAPPTPPPTPGAPGSAVPPWPLAADDVTAEQLIAHQAAHALDADTTFGLLLTRSTRPGTDETLRAQRDAAYHRAAGAFTAAYLLRVLRDADPVAADAAAGQLVSMRNDGDLGEWLWEWNTDAGNDPARIVAETTERHRTPRP